MSENIARLVYLSIGEGSSASARSVHRRLSLCLFALFHADLVWVAFCIGGEDVGYGTDKPAPVQVCCRVGQESLLTGGPER